jgi:hypothetical protein
MQIAVSSRSKTWICGLLPAGIAGSNPTEGMVFCLLRVLCVVRKRSLRKSDLSSRGDLTDVGVSEYDRKTLIMIRPWRTGGCFAMGKNTLEIVTFTIRYKE